MRRYQVVTWSDDCGTDEKMDFNTPAAAIMDANGFQGKEEAAAVYDYQEGIAYAVFGPVSRKYVF